MGHRSGPWTQPWVSRYQARFSSESLYPLINTTCLAEPELPHSMDVNLKPSLHLDIINLFLNPDPTSLPCRLLDLRSQQSCANTKDYYERFPISSIMKITHPLTYTLVVTTVGLPLLVINPLAIS